MKALKYAIIDTETTGLAPDARIVEAAVIHLDPDSMPRVAFEQRFDPEIPIDPGASAVTGIDAEAVRGCPTWVAAGQGVIDACKGRVILAYNAPFDYARIKYECERTSMIAPEWPWVDPLVLLKARDKYGAHRLTEVCEARGIVVEGAHGAACDAMATAILWMMLIEEVGLQNTTLPAYLARQQQRALESEAGYVSWARGKGHKKRPDCPWHELSGAPLPAWPEREKPQGRCPRCFKPATYKIIAGGALTLTSVDGTPHTC